MAGLHWTGHLGRGLFVIGALVVAFATQARADDQYVGVARISVLNGTVVMQHAASADKIAAIVNAPIMVGDYVTTGTDSRAEVQLDDTNFIRVGARTQMRFTRLDATDHVVQLAAGTIELSALRYPDTHPQIQTPSITVRPTDSGRYRVTVTETGDTLVTVRSGRADLVTPSGTQPIGAGTSVLVAGSASDPRIQNVETLAYDDFDAWNNERDRYMASALAATVVAASSYANSGIVGLSDLNSYGRWSYAPAYGSVWIPYNQVGGWSPYHFGRFAWQPYCGWTWIGYEPWGWAPYHYGRWFYQPGFGWAWYPGPRISPYYPWQPALVAFFGFGSGGGFGFSFGNIGWVPLAPFEPFNPWWQGGFSARHGIAFNNVPDMTRVYRNVGAPGGVAVIHGGNFNNGSRYVYLETHNGDLRNVAVAKGGLPVAPSNVSYRYTTGQAEIAHVAPISPRFNALPAPVMPAGTPPIVVHSPGLNTQTAAHVPTANRGDAWSRFGSASNQAVTVVHTMNGTQTFVGSAGGSKANVWNRFGPTGNTTVTGWTTPVMHPVTTVPLAQRYNDPAMYHTPTLPYGQFTPNIYSPGHSVQWMTPRFNMPPPVNMQPRAYMPPPPPSGGAGPVGNSSGHANNGHH
jgi:hypothetical protein